MQEVPVPGAPAEALADRADRDQVAWGAGEPVEVAEGWVLAERAAEAQVHLAAAGWVLADRERAAEPQVHPVDRALAASVVAVSVVADRDRASAGVQALQGGPDPWAGAAEAIGRAEEPGHHRAMGGLGVARADR